MTLAELMNKLLCVTAVSLLASTAGCGLIAGKDAASAERAASKKPSAAASDSKASERARELPDLEGGAGKLAKTGHTKDVAKPRTGDFFVHRFSGSFAQAPLMLTEKVVDVDEDRVTVEYTLEERETTTQLRAVFDADSRRLLSLSRFAGAREEPAAHEALDELLAKTVFETDFNQDLTETKNETCLVGLDEHRCEAKTYRVRVGAAAATLRVTSSPAFPGRDLSGEIRNEEGELLYRAELVEAGADEKEASLALGK